MSVSANHVGYDWHEEAALDAHAGGGLPSLFDSEWVVRAVGDGKVVFAGTIDPDGYTGCSPVTKGSLACRYAVVVQHWVGSALSRYYESYLSGYWHLDSITLGLDVGDTISEGDAVGEVGDTGTTNNEHLHFHVVKVTNTNQFWHQDADDILFVGSTSRFDLNWELLPFIDPFGWNGGSSCKDPASSALYGTYGALSTRLWKPFVGPDDWNHNICAVYPTLEIHDPLPCQ